MEDKRDFRLFVGLEYCSRILDGPPPDCWEGPYLTLQSRTDLHPRYTCGLGCESGTYDW